MPAALPKAPNYRIRELEAQVKSLEMAKTSLESSINEYKSTISEAFAENKRLLDQHEDLKTENRELEAEVDKLTNEIITLSHPVSENNRMLRMLPDVIAEKEELVETIDNSSKPNCSSNLTTKELSDEVQVLSGTAELVDIDSYINIEKSKTKETKSQKKSDLSNRNSSKTEEKGKKDSAARVKDSRSDESGNCKKSAPMLPIKNDKSITSAKGSTTITDASKRVKMKPQEQAKPTMNKQIPGGSANTVKDDPIRAGRPGPKNVNHHSSPAQCLLVHDNFHSDFNANRFTRRFSMSFLRMSRFKQVLQSGCVTTKIKQLKPAVTVLHMGHQDLWDGKSVDEAIDSLKILTHKILEETETRLCVSLVIPVSGYSQLTEKIKEFNLRISRFIRNTRASTKYKDRLYSTDNSKLGEYTSRSVGANGVGIKLNVRGDELLWLRLRDSIDRTLGVEMKGRITYRRKDLDRNSCSHD